jgi:uncharacterized integral membrane protein
MLGLIRTIALVVVVIVATAFFIQNLATTEVVFLTWSIAAPRAVVFFLIFVLGWVAGYLTSAIRPRRAAKTGAAQISPASGLDGSA